MGHQKHFFDTAERCARGDTHDGALWTEPARGALDPLLRLLFVGALQQVQSSVAVLRERATALSPARRPPPHYGAVRISLRSTTSLFR